MPFPLFKGVSAKHGSTIPNVSAQAHEAQPSQTSSAFGVRKSELAEVQTAKPTTEQLVSLHPSELQILTAVNDFTSGWL